MSNPPENSRLILYYNGVISALTLFTQHPDGNVCCPEALPKLSVLVETEKNEDEIIYPEAEKLVANISETMALPQDLLQAVAGFKEQVETPKGIINIYLARFDVLDPPHQLMAYRNCKLKTLLELRGSSDVEMELLRKAYSFILES